MITSAPAALELSNSVQDEAIVFADGLVGCHEWKRFQLLTDDDDEEPLAVAVLQSLDFPEVSLLVTDPRLLLADYNPRLSAEDRGFLGLDDQTQATLFCTLSTAQDGWITANLMGPLVVNPATRRAKQVVLVDSLYSARHPVAQLATDGAGACSS
jgi:flagellar assembly factor FliW